MENNSPAELYPRFIARLDPTKPLVMRWRDDALELNEIHPELEEHAEAIRATITGSPTSFDGRVLLVTGVEQRTHHEMSIELHPSRYSELLALHRHALSTAGSPVVLDESLYYPRPLGFWVAARTADHAWVLGRRSAHVGKHPSVLAVPTEGAKIAETSTPYFDLVAETTRCLQEELGIDGTCNLALDAAVLAEFGPADGINVLVYASLSLSSAEVRDAHAKAVDGWENEVMFLPVGSAIQGDCMPGTVAMLAWYSDLTRQV